MGAVHQSGQQPEVGVVTRIKDHSRFSFVKTRFSIAPVLTIGQKKPASHDAGFHCISKILVRKDNNLVVF
jgi:hypothetical protein